MREHPDRWQIGASVDPEVLALILYRMHCYQVAHETPHEKPPEGWATVASAALDYITAHCIRCVMARNGP